MAMQGLSKWGRVTARIRMPLTAAGAAGIVAASLLPLPSWAWPAALGIFVVGMLLYVRMGTPHANPVDVEAPVHGVWQVLNSPTSRVPSHGIHAWSQTYAIDLVRSPQDGSRPGMGWWPLARRPTDFPGFDAPVCAPVEGTVVRTTGFARDHWSRTSPPGLVFLVVESLRELFGPVGVLGNHVVIRHPEGHHALVAHLERGSIRVRKGQRVRAGQVIAACGNSGNSSEPHVHMQLMDGPSVWTAAGLPFELNGHPPPRNGQVLAT
jgi:Peptidase family M23